MSILSLIQAAVIPFVVTLLVTPLVVKLAYIVGAVDMPNERKVHQTPTPRLGGVGICAALLLSLGLLHTSLFEGVPLPALPSGGLWLAVAILVVFILGVWDDIHALNPGRKFLVQVLAASIVVAAGVRIESVTDLFGSGVMSLGYVDAPVTVLWIVGVANAFNLIDGLDGLASGIALIAALAIAAISFHAGDYGNTVLIMTVVGATAGFLPFNFHRAKIFLGDSGSLVLGFVLAVASIRTSTKGSTAFALLIPILSLGLPLMDTMLSMIRRILHSLLPDVVAPTRIGEKLRSMFLPDRQHIHHRLLALGFSHRTVVLILYAVSCSFGVAAFIVTMNNRLASLILVTMLLAMIVGIRQLRYKEMAILRNGILLPLYEWPALNRSLVQGFIDLAFCAGAFVGSMAIVGEKLPREHLYSTLGLVCTIQLAILAITGLYRNTLRYVGIGDLLRIVKSVGIATIVSGAVLSLLPAQGLSESAWAITISDFYLLLSAVAGSRLSYHILNYLFRKSTHSGNKVLIYGAGNEGIRALERLLSGESGNLDPLGFLDDSPELEGKRINGYPVFGGHWKLRRLVTKYGVDEIIVATSSVRPDILDRVSSTARELGITLRRPHVQWEVVSNFRDRKPSTMHVPDIGSFVPAAEASTRGHE